MRGFIHVLLIGGLFFALSQAEAKEWVSRDGRFTVQAELLTADASEAVLRREDGSVIRVPLERLSLADVKYVQEALQAAGLAAPADTAPATSATPADDAPRTKPKTQAPMSQPMPEPEGPPVAQPGLARWQAAPDPPPLSYDLKPDASVEIPIVTQYSRPFVLFPSSPSPFVVLGGRRNDDPRRLWDLRKEQAIAELDVEIDENDALALSPDGRYLAYNNYRTRGEVRIWSFESGEIVRTLKLSAENSLVRFLEFAGSRRVVVGESKENAYVVYDFPSGERFATIDVELQYDKGSHVLSPGGNYLVVHSTRAQQLAVYDTRNGVRAGRLKTEVESYARPECLAFSADGTELAGYFAKHPDVLQVWSMKDGSDVLTLRVGENSGQSLSSLRYFGRRLEWLADGSGWLLSGTALLDRESGRVIWQDREAINSREVLPRRIVDNDRMLGFRKDQDEQTLCLVPIPKDEIAETRAIVEAGGTAADTGLPPSTSVKTEGAKEVSFLDATWKYQPSVAALPPEAIERTHMPVSASMIDHNRTCFSRPEVARVAVAERLDDSKAPWKSISALPQACRLFDLRSGEQAARFVIPFPTEFLDLSPQGRQGVFCIEPTKDRLDIWDLESGQHVLAFRPYEGNTGYDGRVAWAGFVDENHLVTLSANRKLVAWKLPECQAVYASDAGLGWIAGMTRDRQTMVVVCGNAPHLVNALTGDLIGVLPEVAHNGMLVLPRAGFSADENRLAILFSEDKTDVLAAWDLANQSLLLNLELPFDAHGVVWCGSDHVLLNRTAISDDPDALLDVRSGLIVWNYEAVRGSSLRSPPDGRCWFACRDHAARPYELTAIDLPDKETREYLSKVEVPPPLIGPGASVTVQTMIENPPQAIPPGWSDLEDLDETMYHHFTKILNDKAVNTVPRGDVRLIVGIDKEKSEQTASTFGLFTLPRQVLITKTALTPFVAVLDSNGQRIWSKQPSDGDLEPTDLDECPEGMEKTTFLTLDRWRKAAMWLRSVEIPTVLYHPNVNRGFGESIVTPKGTQIRRAPSPSKVKEPDRTAGVVSGADAQAG